MKIGKLGLIQVSHLEKNKSRHNTLLGSVIAAEEEAEKDRTSNIVMLVLLITIFVLLFFAPSIGCFLFLLFFGLYIGLFGLFQNYKERKENVREKKIMEMVLARYEPMPTSRWKLR